MGVEQARIIIFFRMMMMSARGHKKVVCHEK